MDCTKPPTTHAKFAEGDQSDAKHLQLSRKVAPGTAINLDVCSADITIRVGKDDQFRVAVDFDTAAPNATVGDYVEALDVTPDRVDMRLHLPKHPEGTVLIFLPAKFSKLRVDLVSGEVSIDTEHSSGECKINVVDGHVQVLGDLDSYRFLQVSVLAGSFHDRNARQNSQGMISKSLSGSGDGSIQVNVVRGSVDVKALE